MFGLLDAAGADIRQAFRRLTRAPWLSLVVIATLSVAIAANATIFSLLKPTVLRKLPVTEPQSLVGIATTDIRTGNYSAFYVDVFRALQAEQRSFTLLGAFSSSLVRVEHGGAAFDAGVEGVTPEYFEALGVRAGSGRLFSRDDDPLMAAAAISRRLESRLFGSGTAIGERIVMDGRALEVIGVAADGFEGVRMDGGDDVFLMLPFLRSTLLGSDPKGVGRAQQLIGRLAPGATLETARAEISGRWPGIQQTVRAALPAAHQISIDNQRIAVDSFARGFSGVRDRYGESLMLVMALAAALLIVGCVNLSGLMLARALTRQHEFAVRVAMGVSRGRLIQQVLIDGVLLSLASLLIAVPLSWWASRVLTSMVSVARAIPLVDTTPDLPVLLAATAVSLLAGVVVGLLPARRAVTRGMDDVLRGRGTSHRIGGAARWLMIAQVAASMILVIGAALFVATLANLYDNDLQDHSRPILFTRLARNPLERANTLQQPYFETLQARLAALPGADAAAFSEMYPAFLGFFGGMAADTVTGSDGSQASAITDHVSPGFFDLYSIARLRGRDFTWADNATAPKVVIVNETLARKLSPEGDVVGRRLQITSGPATSDVEVIGVVADANVGSIREARTAGLYRPMMQEIRRGQTPMAHLRFSGDAAAAHRGYVEAVNGLGQHLVRAIFTMDTWVDNAVLEQRLIAGTASAAAMLALVLASVGLFGLVAYSVSSRVREIGVRMSIGATGGDVMRMVVREALAMVIPGIAAGVPLAIAVTWVVRSQLDGVSATDPWMIAGACAAFVSTTAIAALVPALRASRIEPSAALRQD
jgi:putative ABC transport system permease protein